jgi:hypothetical protein
MSIEYTVSGGRIEIDKSVYIKEMLSKDGVLRKILRASEVSNTEIKPKITKNDKSQTVTINFNGSSGVNLGENYRDVFQELKIKYKDKIKGKVVISISTYSIIYVTINLEQLTNE